MTGKIIGRFFFKKTSNGNLVGEWSNSHGTQVFSESADLMEPGADTYLGDYASTWQENKKPIFAILTIRKKGLGPLFTLEWRGTSNFDGEGMLCDNILIGDYHSLP